MLGIFEEGATVQTRGFRTRVHRALLSCSFEAVSLRGSSAFGSIISPTPTQPRLGSLPSDCNLVTCHLTCFPSAHAVPNCCDQGLPPREPCLRLSSHRKGTSKSPIPLDLGCASWQGGHMPCGSRCHSPAKCPLQFIACDNH